MTITARFDSKCPTCSAWIHAGDRVEWTKGSKARHADCEAAKVAREAKYAPIPAFIPEPFEDDRWVLYYPARTLDSMSEFDRLNRTAIKVYACAADAAQDEADHEGWDGEYRIRPIKRGDIIPTGNNNWEQVK
jgi:hypothetical protein